MFTSYPYFSIKNKFIGLSAKGDHQIRRSQEQSLKAISILKSDLTDFDLLSPLQLDHKIKEQPPNFTLSPDKLSEEMSLLFD
jgi:hypothetical protein